MADILSEAVELRKELEKLDREQQRAHERVEAKRRALLEGASNEARALATRVKQ